MSNNNKCFKFKEHYQNFRHLFPSTGSRAHTHSLFSFRTRVITDLQTREYRLWLEVESERGTYWWPLGGARSPRISQHSTAFNTFNVSNLCKKLIVSYIYIFIYWWCLSWKQVFFDGWHTLGKDGWLYCIVLFFHSSSSPRFNKAQTHTPHTLRRIASQLSDNVWCRLHIFLQAGEGLWR